MKNVCVITGGGSGMGLSAAKLLGKDWTIVLTGRTVAKLEDACEEVKATGAEVVAVACDVSDKASVQALADKATSLGPIKGVIHAGAIDSHMGKAQEIVDINAIGTIYVNDIFIEVMEDGGSLVDVSSMAAHMVDGAPLADVYSLALTDPESFREKMMSFICSAADESKQPGMAYSFTKNFVNWYALQTAFKAGKRQIRVVSVSPGTFLTPMGLLGGEHSASFGKKGALGRTGEPDEIGRLLAFLITGGATYLTATDILCDNGTVPAMFGKVDPAIQ